MYWKFSKKEATFLQHLLSGCSKSGFFTKHLAQRGFHPTGGFEKTTCCFIENDVLFYRKRRVVL
jgi:lipoprotein